MPLTITEFPSTTSTVPDPKTFETWADLVAWLTEGPIVTEDKKSVPLWCPATFRVPHRKKVNVASLAVAAFDVDHLTPDQLNDLLNRIEGSGLSAVVYTTHSHGIPESGGALRLVLELTAPVPAEHWRTVWTGTPKLLGFTADPQTHDGSRMLFHYSAHPDRKDRAFARVFEGKPLDWRTAGFELVPAAPVRKREPRAVLLELEDEELAEAKRDALEVIRAHSEKDSKSYQSAAEGGAGRNGGVYKAAGFCKDEALTEEQTIEFLREHEELFDPPPTEQEWAEYEGTIANAFKHGQNEPGVTRSVRKLEAEIAAKKSADARSVIDSDDPDPDRNAPVSLDGLEGSARIIPLKRALRRVLDRVDDAWRVTDPEEFVREWIRRNGHSYDYSRDGFLTPEGFPANLDLLARSVELDRDRLHVRGLSQRAIESSLQLLRPIEERRFLESFRNRLAFDPAGQGTLQTYVRALTGEERELDLAVLRHWVWQIKRKLHGLPVEHHLMPVLQGASGGGKSVAILRLLEPVREVLSSFLGLDVLQDERQVFRLARSYVVFLDEMAKASKVSVAVLKNIITRPELEWRKLGTNTVERAVNNVTLVGASNPRLSELIADPTGMRRFYELRCQDKLDWETVNTFDPLACWREVEERAASPIGPHLKALGEIQTTELVVDPFIEWAEEFLEPSATPTDPATLYTETWTGRAYVDRFRAQNYGVRGVLQLSERQFRARLAEWANDPARTWSKPGQPLAYRKDSAGNMRVWLRLRKNDIAANTDVESESHSKAVSATKIGGVA